MGTGEGRGIGKNLEWRKLRREFLRGTPTNVWMRLFLNTDDYRLKPFSKKILYLSFTGSS
jgi:hypothetical protein